MKRIILSMLVAAGLSLTAVSAQDLKVTELPQQMLRVEPGQYSGITWLGGDRYAVVDDKRNGGGIVFFDIPLREDGSVRAAQVRLTVPEATEMSRESGLDCEGIAYANGKLYVSAESDQSIREYDLDGNATGKSFRIPPEFDKSAIQKNLGFEALTYNATTGKFWTTTEAPLKEDGEDSRLHRFQRFNSRHQPDGCWLYRMDEPIRPQKGGPAALAYVFGISALAALDDGRLIVLEREVFVPIKRSRAILTDSFSHVKLYLADPSVNTSGIMSKRLLCEFETRIASTAAGFNVNLANYEGMCLGPQLPDGRRCLILLADSQGGMSHLAALMGRKRLTNEFVKVILLDYSL